MSENKIPGLISTTFPSPFTSLDSSVLINFLRVNRMDLIERCSLVFFITDHVQEEITNLFSDQKTLLELSLDQKIIQKTNVSSSKEFDIFAELTRSRQLGVGESAAIAVASRGWRLAIDDNQAIKKSGSYLHSNSIIRTQDLIILMIEEGVLAIEEADSLIHVWASEHRFKLKIKSFKELKIDTLV
jgi:predicted nucleic acid-binding protein